jgi:hypothetical protein
MISSQATGKRGRILLKRSLLTRQVCVSPGNARERRSIALAEALNYGPNHFEQPVGREVQDGHRQQDADDTQT